MSSRIPPAFRRAPAPFAEMAALAGLWLAGCSVPVVAPPPVPPPVSAAPAPAPSSSSTPAPAPTAGTWAWSAQMDEAASKLRDGLRGSAVDVAQTTDQRLWLSVAVEEMFPPGRSALKPPATGWLDQVAAALRGLPRAEVQIVGQPDAKGGGSALALDRAASVRDWMVARGVPARRVAVSGTATRAGSTGSSQRVEILIAERAAPR